MNVIEKQDAEAKAGNRAQTGMTPLRVLIVEDSENDATLLEIELQRAGFETSCRRVETAEGMRQALEESTWDVIVADYVMPRFNGLAALGIVKEMGLDIPFIIVSGHIADDTAVAAMKAGAHDYVMKDNFARLGPAVRRELREAGVRRERRRSEERWLEEQTFRQAVENSVPAGIAVVDLEGRQTYVNPAFCAMLGWTHAELLGAQPPFVYWPPDQVEFISESMSRVIRDKAPVEGIELRYRRRTGELIDVLVQVTPLRDSFSNITGWVSATSDITERKRAESRLAAEHAITRILSGAESLQNASCGIVSALAHHLEMQGALLWTFGEGRTSLHVEAAALQHPGSSAEQLLEASRGMILKSGEDLPGQAWQQLKPVWLKQMEDLPPARLEAARAANMRSAAAFPVLGEDGVLAVIELFSAHFAEPADRINNMMAAICSEIAQFMHRRQAEEDLRRMNDELEHRVQQRTVELKNANARLNKAIVERRRLEQELLDLTEKERRRIGLDLHDDLGQKLSGIAMMTKGLELRLAKLKLEEMADAARINEFVQEAISHTRGLARDLATLDLKENDLDQAFKGLCARVKEMFSIECDVVIENTPPALDPPVILHLYKIAQECVTNAIKHAKAKKVEIALGVTGNRLVLRVQNDGYPFPDMNTQSTGMGLRIMSYRASLIGGDFEVRSSGRRGAVAVCTVPLDHKDAAS